MIDIPTAIAKYPLHVTLATLVSRIFQTFRASVDYVSLTFTKRRVAVLLDVSL